MKRISLTVLTLLLGPPLFADAGQRLIPAGALVSCTTGDGRISSKTTAIGDPVLCKVEHQRGDFMLPYDSYLGGQFTQYKDPGHFVGKGWMELDFDRLYVGDTVIPIDAKVVDVKGYKIDSQGRILGKGHVARDITLWCIPVLWPVDLIMLPMRGPRPTLKAETPLTLRVMEDIAVPVTPEPQRDPYGLYQRSPADSYAPQPPPPTQEPDAGPQESYAPQQAPAYEPPPPAAVAYAPLPYAVPVPYAPPVVVAPYPGVYAYGGAMIAPRPGVAAYGPRAYPGGPVARSYAPQGYASRAYAPAAPRAYAPAVRAYGYGYAGTRVAAGGYAARGYAMGGMTSRGSMMAARGGIAMGARSR